MRACPVSVSPAPVVPARSPANICTFADRCRAVPCALDPRAKAATCHHGTASSSDNMDSGSAQRWAQQLTWRRRNRLVTLLVTAFRKAIRATIRVSRKPFAGKYLLSGRDQDRTGDTRIFSPLLYQLSYPTKSPSFLDPIAFLRQRTPHHSDTRLCLQVTRKRGTRKPR